MEVVSTVYNNRETPQERQGILKMEENERQERVRTAEKEKDRVAADERQALIMVQMLLAMSTAAPKEAKTTLLPGPGTRYPHPPLLEEQLAKVTKGPMHMLQGDWALGQGMPQKEGL